MTLLCWVQVSSFFKVEIQREQGFLPGSSSLLVEDPDLDLRCHSPVSFLLPWRLLGTAIQPLKNKPVAPLNQLMLVEGTAFQIFLLCAAIRHASLPALLSWPTYSTFADVFPGSPRPPVPLAQASPQSGSFSSTPLTGLHSAYSLCLCGSYCTS